MRSDGNCRSSSRQPLNSPVGSGTGSTAAFAGLQALGNGREADFSGKRLGVAAHDLSDCAEIKLAVIPETRGHRELGPSHRLVYREFEADDGGTPYREIVAFEPRRDDRPFTVAADRLGRTDGLRREASATVAATSPIAPIRQALPPDIRTALAAAGDVASARGAVTRREASGGPTTGQRRGDPPERGR